MLCFDSFDWMNTFSDLPLIYSLLTSFFTILNLRDSTGNGTVPKMDHCICTNN